MSANVLIVEDTIDLCEMLAVSLTDAGFRVRTAARLRDARKLFREERPDVLVVDGLLPDGTGVEFISSLRRGGATVPVVFLSAFWKDAKSRQQLQSDLGVRAVLRKPHDVGRLVDAVRDALA